MTGRAMPRPGCLEPARAVPWYGVEEGAPLVACTVTHAFNGSPVDDVQAFHRATSEGSVPVPLSERVSDRSVQVVRAENTSLSIR